MVKQYIDFQQLEVLQDKTILACVDLDEFAYSAMSWPGWLEEKLKTLRRPVYENHHRLVFVYHKDFYSSAELLGKKLQCLQEILNKVDISNFFCVVVSSNPNLVQEAGLLHAISSDNVPVWLAIIPGDFEKVGIESQKVAITRHHMYNYNSTEPVKVTLDSLRDRQRFLLSESKFFCIYPWTHLHAWPTGEVWPCCHAEPKSGALGSAKTHTLKQVWNGDAMKTLRLNMLNEKHSEACVRCYEQEQTGFFSGRRSANKHHGHHIAKTDLTNTDGSLDSFEMVYWDIRFSNLCNLRCRTCGYIFSSQWWKDQKQLMGDWADKWARETPVLNHAGRYETDMWEQMLPHLDYVQQIYFAGGEPLIMEEHYRILDELEKRQRFDVRLIYNTNFTETKLKGRSVFEYWNKFESVSIGASLDGMGKRAEYIRKGTTWAQIEKNRREMLEICPEVDFYISPTLSILNALHLVDFHRAWVEMGLIRPQDININILQDPLHYRIDIAPTDMKSELKQSWQSHLEWLADKDPLQRASNGFRSAIAYMDATDNSHLIPLFWNKTHELDKIRNEKLLDYLPELARLKHDSE